MANNKKYYFNPIDYWDHKTLCVVFEIMIICQLYRYQQENSMLALLSTVSTLTGNGCRLQHVNFQAIAWF